MGCGSSRSAVAVVETNKTNVEKEKPKLEQKTSSLDHFMVTSSTKELNVSSSPSLKNKNNLENGSVKSLQDANTRERSAASIKSKDSGVFDESNERGNSARGNSARSLSSNPELAHNKPPSGKRSTARKKLLRIEDNDVDSNQETDDNSMNIINRPKSRFGNVAFDLMLDIPETGNMKKRPEKLAQLKTKRKRSKKVKTKADLDRKLEEADQRRKHQETEKQLKAKQFQHLAVNTTVQPFTEPADEEEERDSNNNTSINDKLNLFESNNVAVESL